jgi:hypothetical protein
LRAFFRFGGRRLRGHHPDEPHKRGHDDPRELRRVCKIACQNLAAAKAADAILRTLSASRIMSSREKEYPEPIAKLGWRGELLGFEG